MVPPKQKNGPAAAAAGPFCTAGGRSVGKGEHRPGGEGMQALPQLLRQQGAGGSAGAVAGKDLPHVQFVPQSPGQSAHGPDADGVRAVCVGGTKVNPRLCRG